MNKLEAIEREVETLTHEELAGFRAWFLERDYKRGIKSSNARWPPGASTILRMKRLPSSSAAKRSYEASKDTDVQG